MVCITSNQIAYNAHLEQVRHNKVTEGETQRHNVTTEQEQGRHNLATEDYQNRSLLEQTRHNHASESLQAQQIATQYAVGMAAAAATRYAASMNYAGTVYSANLQSKTSLATKSLDLVRDSQNRANSNVQKNLDRANSYRTALDVAKINKSATKTSATANLMGSAVRGITSLVGTLAVVGL